MRVFGRTNGAISALAARLTDCDAALRWGGPFVPGAINGQIHLLNGLEQLEAMQAANVRVPLFTNELDQALDLWRNGYTMFGRKLNHTQGRDIIPWGPFETPRRWLQRAFWTAYVPAQREWRFHIFKGQSIARGVKVFTGTEPPRDPVIRSRRLLWHLDHTVNPPKGARTVAKAAAAACGYELAAVDMLELEGGAFCVLECNSRPAIRDEYTIAAYAAAFRRL